MSYLTAYFPNTFQLNANQLYWIVVSGAATMNGSNNYQFAISTPYSRGSWSYSSNSGSSYANFLPSPVSMAFRVLYGGQGGTSAVKHSVVYTPKYL